MRRYETIIIIDPDAKEDERSGLIERIGELIPKHDGLLVDVDDWGQRRMAYEVKKKIRGHYTRFDFCGNGVLVDEMERTFRIDDRVMKYMTVLLEDHADVEAIKQAIEARTAEADKNDQANTRTDSAEQANQSRKTSDASVTNETQSTTEE